MPKLKIFKDLSKYFEHITFELVDTYNASMKFEELNDILNAQNYMFNWESAIHKLINELRIDANKIVMGLHFRAIEYKKFLKKINSIKINKKTNQPIKNEKNDDNNVTFERFGTYMAYNRLCDIQLYELSIDVNKQFKWNSLSSNTQPNLGITQQINAIKSIETIILFDSIKTIEYKTEFAMKNNLIGIMALFIDADDFLGHCDTAQFDQNGKKWNQNTFPLLRSIDATINKFESENKHKQRITPKNDEEL